jgi:hypothetical protein
MQAPTALALLDVWESTLGKDLARCGLALLAAACPGSDVDLLATLSIGERDRRLLSLRESVFGPRMTMLATCARCEETLEFELSAAELQTPPATAENGAALAVDHDAWHVELRAPDSRDLIAAADAPQHAEDVLFARSVRAATFAGTPADPLGIPSDVRALAAERLAAVDPQADLQFALTCAKCGSDWRAPLDIVSFLWAELDAWAGRMLRDVHVLASAYGWAEGDILALSAARRGHYLRLVGA